MQEKEFSTAGQDVLAIEKSVANEPEQMTREQYKKAMRVWFTQRNSVVTKCGHKFHPVNEPKNNCMYCWFAYFQTHGETTQIAEECFQKEGKDILIKLKGKKFFKNWLRFMAALAQYQKEQLEGNGITQTSDTNANQSG